MNNLEIETLLKDYPVTVCCANELPATIKKRPQTFVVNTDTCDKSGTHWITFHFPIDGPLEFFDSAGNAPEVYHQRFLNVLLVNGPSFLYTTDRLQPAETNTCGLYCIYFVERRYRKMSMKNVLRDFSTTRLKENDRKVIDDLSIRE